MLIQRDINNTNNNNNNNILSNGLKFRILYSFEEMEIF